MKKLIATSLLLAFSTTLASDEALLDQDFRRLASDEIVNLGDEYKGKVLLIVNTASKCGNTPQYDGLEKLYQEYGDKGLNDEAKAHGAGDPRRQVVDEDPPTMLTSRRAHLPCR